VAGEEKISGQLRLYPFPFGEIPSSFELDLENYGVQFSFYSLPFFIVFLFIITIIYFSSSSSLYLEES